ncbi:S-layer homology domain-containing protein [Brevibacillus thermoruber]|uniref:S-layer homology domain-containing protein n=1 Tax=Brevibacillus thermoruber TaxID=33942 RepID=UPI00068E5413|nr:S-layer homology domain-containing protein [Brevibacillus thermoruber]
MKRFSIVALVVACIVSLQSSVSAHGLFHDVHGHWAEATINWAADKHVVNGYPDGTFKPNKQVNEAEFLTMLLNFYGKNQGTKNWPYPYYDYAKSLKWPVYGKDEQRKKPVTREHVAELIAHSLGTNYRGEEAVQYLLMYQFAKGKGDKITIASFDPDGAMTRAEAAQFLKNLFDKGATQLKPVVPAPPLPPVTSTTPITPVTGGAKPTLPPDAASQQSVEALVDSLKMDGNQLTGVVPKIPSGYRLSVHYKANIPFSKPVALKNKNAGDSFTLEVGKEGGKLMITLDVGGEIKNGATVYLPEMKVVWEAGK